MNPIKYRIWCKNKNEWETDEVAILPGGSILHISTKNKFPCMIKKETHEIQMFTGLLDKNDKEIYEGDIVVDENYHNWSVVFNYGAFGIFHDDSNNYHALKRGTFKGLVFIPKYCVEIIGNIYENPELLTPTLKRGGGNERDE